MTQLFDPLTGEVKGESDPKACPGCVERDRRHAAIETDLHLAEDALRKERRIVSALKTELHKLQEEAPEAKVAKALFRYWIERCAKDKGRTKFGEARSKKVLARLRDGYTPAYIARAIDGAAEHAYVNPETGVKYDDLELICRNEVNLERFHRVAEATHAKTLAGPAWLAEFEPAVMQPTPSSEPF